jgi:hypothetical protein
VGGFAVKIIARRMAAVPPSPDVAPSVPSGFGVKLQKKDDVGRILR